ncbi:MAG: hypothetical protein GY757_43470 [bacterium]|nr:hypothetical protein [bacterium]
MKKKIFFILTAILLSNVVMLNAQSLTQIGFIVKKAIPDVKNIMVLATKADQAKYEKEARSAIIITKKKFAIYSISSVGEITKALYAIQEMKKVAVIAIANETTLNSRSIKYTAQKLGLKKKIPLISTRAGDTKMGAMITISNSDKGIAKHINRIVASALKITIPEAFLEECVVDVE